jgi:lipopolysaccharide transport system permease protein
MEVRIRPQSRLKLVDFAALWVSRDLLIMLVWRDFAARYKQTLLGPIWFLLQPILPTLVFVVVFNRIAGLATAGSPAFLFYFANQIVWGFFAANYTSTANVLLGNMHLFTKVYFPRLTVPLAGIVGSTLAVAIQLAVFAVAWCWYRFGQDTPTVSISPLIALFPLVLVLAAAQALGFGLWMASITAKYRDLQQLSAVLIQLWMYGSAVILPLAAVPARYRPFLSANPLTFTVEAFRACLLGSGSPSWPLGLYSVGTTIFVMLSGLYLFNQSTRTFVDIA